MPNWVFNTLTIQGPKTEIDYIKDKLNEPFTREHENWSIEKQEMITETITYSNPVFSFWNIIRPTDLVEYTKQPKHDLQNGNDWYSWNIRNWGTKWDIGIHDNDKYPDTELVQHMSNAEDNWLVYRLNTAWSPPITALEKLSELVPTCVVTLEWQEEQGFGGEIEFLRGEITSQSDYESQCMDCNAYNTMEYCDNDCGNVCSKCNWLGEADLECVAECDTHKVFLDEEHVPEYRRA